MTLTSAQRDALRKRCALILPDFRPTSPAEVARFARETGSMP